MSIEARDIKYIYPKRGEIYEADLGIGDGSHQLFIYGES